MTLHMQPRPQSVPARYLLLMLELAEARGVAPEALLHGLGVDATALADPSTRVSLQQNRELCLRSMAMTGDEALGIEFGLHATMTTFGMVGFAMMTQPTLAAAFDFADRYGTRLQLPAWDLHFYRDGSQAVVDAVEIVRDEALHRFACEQLIVSFLSMFHEMVSETEHCELCFDFAEPPYFHRYRQRLPAVRHGAGVTQFRFPRHCLEWPLRKADPIAAQLAESRCARILDTLIPDDDVVRQVQNMLRTDEDGYPSLPVVAARLNTTERTLARRLCAAGHNYRTLLERARHRDSLLLLDDASMTVSTVARRLGYGATANFCRAFRRWTGVYPGVFRSQRLGTSGRASPAVTAGSTAAVRSRGDRGRPPQQDRRSR